MAKWGEGDPRWIVEERPDATNVNNWHWTEKNACQWSVDKLKSLLTNFPVEDNIAKCKITEVEKCEGEAVAHNRKANLLFFYEWVLKLKWEGRLSGGEKHVTGTIEIPNLSDENDVSEVAINVSVSDSDNESDKLKEFMYRKGSDIIREQLQKYITSLKQEFAQGMILPKKDSNSQSDKQPSVASVASDFNKVCVNGTPPTHKKSDSKGHKLSTTNIEYSQKFQCTGEELYNALTMPELVQAFTMGPVKMDVQKGGHFEILNGSISGTFVDLVPGKKIVQQWRIKHWPEGYYSTVTFKISQQDDHTLLDVSQKDVPASDVESLKENWNRYYWQAMKRTFGFGSIITDF